MRGPMTCAFFVAAKSITRCAKRRKSLEKIRRSCVSKKFTLFRRKKLLPTSIGKSSYGCRKSTRIRERGIICRKNSKKPFGKKESLCIGEGRHLRRPLRDLQNRSKESRKTL